MKKFMLALACIIASTLVVSCDYVTGDDAASDRSTTQTISTSVAMYNYVFSNYSATPISICKGTLTTSSGTKTIYLVALSGTQIKSNQSTGIITDFEAGFSIQSAYLTDVKNAMVKYIPNGSNVVLAGHSLGGMICQQIASDSTMKADYVILNTVTFGSPLLGWLSREGATQRLGDSSDVVPYLSISSLFGVTLLWEALGLNVENGGYGANLLNAHIQSYANATEWSGWNAIGYYNQTGSIVLDLSTKQQIAAPSGWVSFTY